MKTNMNNNDEQNTWVTKMSNKKGAKNLDRRSNFMGEQPRWASKMSKIPEQLSISIFDPPFVLTKRDRRESKIIGKDGKVTPLESTMMRRVEQNDIKKGVVGLVFERRRWETRRSCRQIFFFHPYFSVAKWSNMIG